MGRARMLHACSLVDRSQRRRAVNAQRPGMRIDKPAAFRRSWHEGYSIHRGFPAFRSGQSPSSASSLSGQPESGHLTGPGGLSQGAQARRQQQAVQPCKVKQGPQSAPGQCHRVRSGLTQPVKLSVCEKFSVHAACQRVHGGQLPDSGSVASLDPQGQRRLHAGLVALPWSPVPDRHRALETTARPQGFAALPAANLKTGLNDQICRSWVEYEQLMLF